MAYTTLTISTTQEYRDRYIQIANRRGVNPSKFFKLVVDKLEAEEKAEEEIRIKAIIEALESK